MEIKDNKIKKDILGSYVYRSSFNPFNIPKTSYRRDQEIKEKKSKGSQRPKSPIL